MSLSRIISLRILNVFKAVLISCIVPWKNTGLCNVFKKWTIPDQLMKLGENTPHKCFTPISYAYQGAKFKEMVLKTNYIFEIICFSYIPKWIRSRIVTLIHRKHNSIRQRKKVVPELIWNLPLMEERVAELPCSKQTIPSIRISFSLLTVILRFKASPRYVERLTETRVAIFGRIAIKHLKQAYLLTKTLGIQPCP